MSNQLDKTAVVSRSEDVQKILKWQDTKDPSELVQLVVRYQPIISSIVNKYRTTGVSTSTLRSKASTQLLKALRSYDPKFNTAPSTHIWNSLQKVQRTAGGSLQSGHIPENRGIKRSTFVTVRDNLTDQIGYEPNVKQMADEMNWSQSEVQRMNKELAGEITASSAEFDFFGNSTQFANKDRELVDYLYHDLKDKDKIIFEHTFGYGGKPLLKNNQIAKMLNTNEMAVHRAKKRLASKIREYR